MLLLLVVFSVVGLARGAEREVSVALCAGGGDCGSSAYLFPVGDAGVPAADAAACACDLAQLVCDDPERCARCDAAAEQARLASAADCLPEACEAACEAGLPALYGDLCSTCAESGVAALAGEDGDTSRFFFGKLWLLHSLFFVKKLPTIVVINGGGGNGGGGNVPAVCALSNINANLGSITSAITPACSSTAVGADVGCCQAIEGQFGPSGAYPSCLCNPRVFNELNSLIATTGGGGIATIVDACNTGANSANTPFDIPYSGGTTSASACPFQAPLRATALRERAPSSPEPLERSPEAAKPQPTPRGP